MERMIADAMLAVALSLPVALVAWLVVEAERARQLFRPTRTCRRQ